MAQPLTVKVARIRKQNAKKFFGLIVHLSDHLFLIWKHGDSPLELFGWGLPPPRDASCLIRRKAKLIGRFERQAGGLLGICPIYPKFRRVDCYGDIQFDSPVVMGTIITHDCGDSIIA